MNKELKEMKKEINKLDIEIQKLSKELKDKQIEIKKKRIEFKAKLIYDNIDKMKIDYLKSILDFNNIEDLFIEWKFIFYN